MSSKEEKFECEVCIEKYNKSSHQKVTCIFCSYEVCRKCCEYYILSSIREAECMNCKKEWTRDFLVKNFTMKFINGEYKSHREKILFEKEKSILPRTQRVVERMRYEENLQKQIVDLENQLAFLRREHGFVRYFNPRAIELGIGETDAFGGAAGGSSSTSVERFSKKCPGETCKGFLNYLTWRCGLCDVACCKDCHSVVIDSDNTGQKLHECNPDDVASAKLISKDSKSCPKCGVMIFRSEGCSQMWCTQCHVAFDWKTGQIETKNIHNPHYYEYLRRVSPTGEIPRNPLDVVGEGGGEGGAAAAVACAGRAIPHVVNDYFVRSIMFFVGGHKGFRKEDFLGNKLLGTEKKIDPRKIDRVEYIEMCRNIIHLREVEVPRFEETREVYEDLNRDLRIKYLSNRLSEETFKFEIQKREKSSMKKKEISNILETIIQAFTDVSFRFKADHENEDATTYIQEFEGIVKYANECFDNVSKNYCSKRLHIDYLFELSRNRK